MVVHNQEEKLQINEIIISCRSLSHYESKKFKAVLPQLIATVVAGSLHIVIGLSFTFSAILLPQLAEIQNGTDTDIIYISESEGSWITSAFSLVAPLGALGAGFIMDSMGRLNMLKLTAIPNILGWILIATASNVPMLVVGRILTGIASVWGTSPASVYVTEIGRPDVRGSLLAVLPFCISVGVVLGYFEGWLMNWRLVAWLCNVYTIVPVVLMMFLPESPAWLVSKDRIEEARKSLEWFHKYQPQPEYKLETFSEMQLSLLQKEHQLKLQEQEQLSGNSFTRKAKMFLQPTGYKPLLIMTGVFFLQQFSGIYIILFYGVSFVEEMGTPINPYLASVSLGIMRLIMTFANTWLMKKFNRRSLFMVSAAGMSVCMGISGLYTKWIQNGETTNTWVPVVALMLYFMLTTIGLMPIPFTIIAELFPLAIRGVSHSIVSSIASLAMFLALRSYYPLSQAFGGSSGVQYFFGVVSLGALVFGFVFLPETHRKKLSEIEEYFWGHTTYLSVPSEEKRLDKSLKQKNNVQRNTRDTK